jgi:hypothetical protein
MNAEVKATIDTLVAACNETIARADMALIECEDMAPAYVIVSERWNRRVVYVIANRYILAPYRNPHNFASERSALRVAADFMADVAKAGKPEALHVIRLRDWYANEKTDALKVLEDMRQAMARHKV